MKYFNPAALERLGKTTVTTKTGVRYGFVDNILKDDMYERLLATFPNPKTYNLVDKQSGGGHKRFYAGPGYVCERDCGSVWHLRALPFEWRELFDETASLEFIAALANATGVTFNTLNNFGLAYGDEGCVQEPHLGGAVRPGSENLKYRGKIAILMYFNDDSDPVSATELYDVDRRTIIAKGNTMRNSMFFFEQHKNAWHGFPEVPKGHTRQILSLAYSDEQKPVSTSWSFLRYVLNQGIQKLSKG